MHMHPTKYHYLHIEKQWLHVDKTCTEFAFGPKRAAVIFADTVRTISWVPYHMPSLCHNAIKI